MCHCLIKGYVVSAFINKTEDNVIYCRSHLIITKDKTTIDPETDLIYLFLICKHFFEQCW